MCILFIVQYYHTLMKNEETILNCTTTLDSDMFVVS